MDIPKDMKFLVIGGEVVSKDNQCHYIMPHRLISLYNIPKNQVMGIIDNLRNRGSNLIRRLDTEDNIYILNPLIGGDYKKFLEELVVHHKDIDSYTKEFLQQDAYRRVKELVITSCTSIAHQDCKVTLESNLIEDLCFDSMDLTELEVDIESEFDILLDSVIDWNNITTVEDLVNFVFINTLKSEK